MFVRPRPAPFAVSLLTHGLILAWVSSGPVVEKPKSLYALTIAPHQSKLVWYNFREKLPEVSPTAMSKPLERPRAEVKIASQEIMAGTAKAPRARQFIWQPAPKLEMQKDVSSPNLLAFHPPHVEPPHVEAPPKPKVFVPPVEAPKPVAGALAVAAPPEIRTANNAASPGNVLGMQPVKAQPRNFVAPRAGEPENKAAAALPEAPAVAANLAAPTVNLGKMPVAPHRDFVAPAGRAKPSALGPALPDAPALPETGAAVSVAIVGLDPKVNVPAPAPEGSRNAQFAAGPQPRPGAAEPSAEGGIISVPGLLVHNGTTDTKPALMARAPAPTALANLRAAVHSALPAAPAAGPHPTAMRVTSAPEPMLDGREIYAMSIQMPNTTSYTGSWMVWFAARERDTAAQSALSAPVPLRKVDPKYYPAAIADRVEGKVRLAAVIRADGQVVSVKVLQHLDDRLDHSAQEAMDKWLFEPATRAGQAVDVDAVIEIPFRLAPKTAK